MTLNEDLLWVQYEDFPPPPGLDGALAFQHAVYAAIPYQKLIQADGVRDQIAPEAFEEFSPMALLTATRYLCDELLARDEPGMIDFLVGTYDLPARQAWLVVAGTRPWRERQKTPSNTTREE